MLLSLLGLAGGIGMPMQTSINAHLGRRVGSPVTAAMINFMVGISALLIVTLLVERDLAIPVEDLMKAPPWVMLGGVLAVIFIMANILLMPRIGSVQTAILPALGQIVMGTLIDTFGWFDSDQKDMTFVRAIGIALVFSGVIVVIMSKTASAREDSDATKTDSDSRSNKTDGEGGSGKSGAQTAMPVGHIWLWRAFGLIAGMSMAAQTAINSHLGLVVESRFFAAVVNFSVGFSILIVLHFLLLKTKKPGIKDEKAPPWLLTGGLFGVLFVIGNIVAGQTVGTGMAVVLLLTGLMIGGLIVDRFGLFRSAKRPVGIKEIGGVLMMIVGAVLFHAV